MTHWSKLLLITDEVTVVVLQFGKTKQNYSIESSKAAQNDPDSHQRLYLFIFTQASVLLLKYRILRVHLPPAESMLLF